MELYGFDITNDCEDQQFLCWADDLTSALMKAMDFAQKLDERLKEKFPDRSEDQATKVVLVAKANFVMADEAGLQKYLDSINIAYCEDED